MPRTSVSVDDAVVGQNVPSTTVDSSTGTGTTLPASSSNVDNAGDAGKQAVIVRSTQKFGIKTLAVKRAPTDALLEARGETDDDSTPKSAVEKPPSTPEMSARKAEDMAVAMLRNSPLPDTEKSDERLPEGDGSDKLPEEEDGDKLPEGSDAKLPEDTPTGKLVMPRTEKVLFFALSLIN